MNSKRLVIITLALLPFMAAARTVPASQGRPQYWSDGPFFSMDGSAMVNVGSGRKSFEIPLVVDYAGAKTVEVTILGTTPNSVACQAVGMHRDHVINFPTSPRVSNSGSFTPQVLSLTGASVPYAGYLFVNCQVDPGAWIFSVNYNA